MAAGSKKVIIAALIGNGLIAIAKFIASVITGSSAMLSEAIHSVVDTGNQGLLLFGLRRSKRKADARHPFGYGMEMYFWAFVVAMLIFAVGAGVSIYEGVHKVMHPEAVKSPIVNYIVLSLALCFESVAWWIAFKEFRKTKGDKTYWQAVKGSKDPALFTVLFEDSAAMAGLLVAFIGIALSQILDMPILDGVASIIIGVILAITAVVLAIETKGLLIGEAANKPFTGKINEIIAGTKGIAHVNELLTMHMGPDDVLVTMSLDFDDSLSSSEVEAAIHSLDKRIKQEFAQVKRLFIEAQSFESHSAVKSPDKLQP